jgi:hypothetical protein
MENKRRILAVIAVVGSVMAIWATSSPASQNIVGSKHDFTLTTNGTLATGWNSGQICMPCHTPHNAIISANGVAIKAPLWNHNVANTAYTLFGVHGATPTVGAIDSTSMLCLSCHDGTMALSAYQFSSATGTDAALTMNNMMGRNGLGSGSFGTDLSRQHPIGVVALYTTSTTSTSWASPATLSKTPLQAMADGTQVVGCDSCHTPHNSGNKTYPGIPGLLNVPVSGSFTTGDGRTVPGSGLCLNCHIK